MTPRISTPLALLLVLTAASLAFFIYYGQWFPPTMTVHFDSVGQPDQWMDRVKFIVIGTSACFMAPAFLVAGIGVMPRVLPIGMIRIPNRDYWFAPERREASLSRLMVYALWLGCVVEAGLLATFVLIARSNPAGEVPHLAGGTEAVIVGCGAALVLWGVRAVRAFGAPR